MGVETTSIGINLVIETIQSVFDIFESLGF